MAQISISDTGMGIAPGDIKKIFHPFTRTDSSNKAEISGIGIGLTLCKKLIKQLNGTIDVESTLGIGSTFRINFPLIDQSSE